jgi:hypothetical protein
MGKNNPNTRKAYYEKCKAEGKCVHCMKESRPNRVMCQACNDKFLNRKKKYRKEGRCADCQCKLPSDYKYRRCQKCLKYNQKRLKKRRKLHPTLCTTCMHPLMEFDILSGRKKCGECTRRKSLYNNRSKI